MSRLADFRLPPLCGWCSGQMPMRSSNSRAPGRSRPTGRPRSRALTAPLPACTPRCTRAADTPAIDRLDRYRPAGLHCRAGQPLSLDRVKPRSGESGCPQLRPLAGASGRRNPSLSPAANHERAEETSAVTSIAFRPGHRIDSSRGATSDLEAVAAGTSPGQNAVTEMEPAGKALQRHPRRAVRHPALASSGS